MRSSLFKKLLKNREFVLSKKLSKKVAFYRQKLDFDLILDID